MLPPGDYNPLTFVALDSAAERGRSVVYIPLATSGNLTSLLALITTLQGTLFTPTTGLSACTCLAIETYVEVIFNVAAAADANCHIAMLVQYRDATTLEPFEYLIFSPILANFEPDETPDGYSISSPLSVTAFIAAFEALAIPPENPTHASEVYGLKLISLGVIP